MHLVGYLAIVSLYLVMWVSRNRWMTPRFIIHLTCLRLCLPHKAFTASINSPSIPSVCPRQHLSCLQSLTACYSRVKTALKSCIRLRRQICCGCERQWRVAAALTWLKPHTVQTASS